MKKVLTYVAIGLHIIVTPNHCRGINPQFVVLTLTRPLVTFYSWYRFLGSGHYQIALVL